MEMLRRYWMFPYQASGISGKSPEDGGGEEEEEEESGGGVAAGEKLRCIANFFLSKLQFLSNTELRLFFRFNEEMIWERILSGFSL